jgi:hypothetical protein
LSTHRWLVRPKKAPTPLRVGETDNPAVEEEAWAASAAKGPTAEPLALPEATESATAPSASSPTAAQEPSPAAAEAAPARDADAANESGARPPDEPENVPDAAAAASPPAPAHAETLKDIFKHEPFFRRCTQARPCNGELDRQTMARPCLCCCDASLVALGVLRAGQVALSVTELPYITDGFPSRISAGRGLSRHFDSNAMYHGASF